MRVWRICKGRHALSAFSGEGARLFSGRWNEAGVPVVYTSLSLSLAAMETFVHLEPTVAPDDLVSIRAELPVEEPDVERVELERLPKDWKRVDHAALRQIGGEWIRSGRSLALLVPSAVVEGEWNALVNPAHPGAAKVQVAAVKEFRFDARMFRATQTFKGS